MVYVIVGNGPAGTNAIEQIRNIDQTGKIILIAQEANLPYSRITIPEYMTNKVEEQDIYIRSDDFYENYRIETRLGHRVEQVLAHEKVVILENGERIPYDKLLLATGSRPFIPSWIDMEVKGVFSLWNKADSEAIKEFMPQVKNAVIIGGGLVGLQAARALNAYGINVSVVEMANRLMPAQLDQAAEDMLRNALVNHGVQVFLGTEVKSLQVKDNKLEGVQTADQFLEAELVIVAVGVRPNLDFLAESSVQIERGIVVNEFMQSSVPTIYAAGDIAQATSMLTGESMLRALWLTAVQQGKIAGASMAGSREAYLGSHAMNSIQLFGLPIISLGRIEGGLGVEEVILSQPSSGVYQKLLLEDGRLTGLIFAGEVQEAGILYHKLGQRLNQGYWGSLRVSDPEYMLT